MNDLGLIPSEYCLVGRAGSKAEGVAERFADPRCTRGSQAIWRSSPPTMRGCVMRRSHPAPRWEKKHDKGPAVTVLAQQSASAVYDRLHRQVAFERETCCQRYGRGADEPGASLDHQGRTLPKATRLHAWRQGTPRRLEVTRPSALHLCLAIRSRSCLPRRSSPTAGGCGPSPEPGSHGTTRCVAPTLGRGREEGTEKVLGRSARTDHALPSAPRRREHRKTCVVQPRTVCAVIRQSSPHTRPSADCARNLGGKKAKNLLSGPVCLLTRGGLIRVIQWPPTHYWIPGAAIGTGHEPLASLTILVSGRNHRECLGVPPFCVKRLDVAVE